MKVMDLAAHVINRCIDLDKPVSNLKLQKMLYFLDINFLINFDKKLIDEDFEAWQYGPVQKEVYDKYSFFAASSIRIRQEPENDWTLVEYSHRDNTPWSKVYRNGAGNHQKIPNELLREYAQNIKNEKE